MTALLGPIFGAMGIAADITGVPGLGVATTILQAIKANCDQVVAHKVSSLHASQTNDRSTLHIRRNVEGWLRRRLNCVIPWTRTRIGFKD